MSAPGSPDFDPGWLTLREGADAAARSAELLEPLEAYLTAVRRSVRWEPQRRHGQDTQGNQGNEGNEGTQDNEGSEGPDRLVIRDLGCGTGSLGRWLAGRLHGPQHWILHDRDPELLALARATMTTGTRPAPGRTVRTAVAVTVETAQGDVTALSAGDLAGTSLVAASALLDLFTREEVDRLAAACTGAGCPALFTLSVSGSVRLDPVDPLDQELAAAFDAHQRRETGGRRLLGPDAVDAAAEAFERRGAVVRTAASPWRLGPGQAALTAEWLKGWVAAAVEQRPELAGAAADYLSRRLELCAAGGLHAVVQHRDLLALPGPMRANSSDLNEKCASPDQSETSAGYEPSGETTPETSTEATP